MLGGNWELLFRAGAVEIVPQRDRKRQWIKPPKSIGLIAIATSDIRGAHLWPMRSETATKKSEWGSLIRPGRVRLFGNLITIQVKNDAAGFPSKVNQDR